MPQAKSEPAAGPPRSSAAPRKAAPNPCLGWKQKSYDLATFTSCFVLTLSTPDQRREVRGRCGGRCHAALSPCDADRRQAGTALPSHTDDHRSSGGSADLSRDAVPSWRRSSPSVT